MKWLGVVWVGISACSWLACGSDEVPASNPTGDAGPGASSGLIPDLPPGELPPASSFVELTGTSVATTGSQTCAILPDGRIVCWGGSTLRENALGKNAWFPTGPASAVQITAGVRHFCARYNDGSVRCWGTNDAALAGLGAADAKEKEATLVVGLANVQSLSAGADHTCAVAGGKVSCWGNNSTGELGDGTHTAHGTPVEVPGLTDVAAVAAGVDFSCALLTNKRVECWGDNRSSQIGVASQGDVTVPAEVAGLGEVDAIDAGDETACALRAGKVVCWGAAAVPSSASTSYTPTPLIEVQGVDGAITFALERSTAAATYAGGCASTASATLCWETPWTDQVLTGIAVAGAGAAAQLSTNVDSSCGVFAGQRVQCWGANDQAQLGDGTFASHPTPLYVPGIDSAEALFVGERSNCIRRKDQSVRCWGYEDDVRDVDGAAFDAPSLRGASLVLPGALYQQHCALLGGAPHCEAAPHLQPKETYAVTGAAGLTDLAFGDQTGCGLLADGTLTCWKPGPTATAAPVAGIVGVHGIFARSRASFETMCIVQDTVHCTRQRPPTQAADFEVMDAAFAGATAAEGSSAYYCATTPAGVVCDGGVNVEPRGLIAESAGATMLTVGAGFGCALVGGSVRCWGQGQAGALGPSSFSFSATPVVVADVAPPIALAAASGHTCALGADGRVQCWGYNNGASITPRADYRSSPAQVRLLW